MVLSLAFMKGFLFSLSLCFDLGIVNVAMIKTGLEKGFKRSFMLGFGSCFGDLTYLILALAGVTIIFQIPAVRWVLWIGGTIVLTCLTVQMIRKTIKPDPIRIDEGEVKGNKKEFVWGLGLALSSPTVILWFAVAAGPILATLNVHSAAPLTAFIIGFFVAGMAWSAFIAIVSGISHKRASTGFVRAVSFLSALIFLLLAVKVFTDGFHSLLS
ncbi:LysE family translocator [Paenibacillus montanisoli]|uniref:Lysine transporter LysE n=1 Tax=Paenibacillus montanisoli TaxID=2081970 RepID=A0A328U5V3_9BACL|nr:LysE family transporter [Paenibacillus montanisoli]RAP75414.1 lysine transporter LysE [Paenibacillus montanisoli]